MSDEPCFLPLMYMSYSQSLNGAPSFGPIIIKYSLDAFELIVNWFLKRTIPENSYIKYWLDYLFIIVLSIFRVIVYPLMS